MKQLSDSIVQFFQKQGCVIIASVDKSGFPHTSCKGIIKIDKKGAVYLLDAYKGKTSQNLRNNPSSSITVFDEDKFVGFCLKGNARVLSKEELGPDVIRAWEEKIASRLTQRLLKNIRGETKGHPRHPEALLPKPEHMIVVDVQEVVDLTPHHLK